MSEYMLYPLARSTFGCESDPKSKNRAPVSTPYKTWGEAVARTKMTRKPKSTSEGIEDRDAPIKV
jgi:hypothetical protein